ncbi:MAG: Integrase, partial [Pseudonocardiales bacterium]|nr:Integrase [Pseudonocardiales bacterium]
MGRPPLPLGTFGKVLFIEHPNGRIEARAKFRDYDGRVRLVAKNGRSRAAAERALKAELAGRQTPGGHGAITTATRIEALADAWLVGAHGWSTGTERTYRSVVNKQVKPALGQLRIREVTPGVVSRALTAVARSSGPGAAKSTRACLSGMFGLAIEDGVITANPVRDSVARISPSKKSPRALTPEETAELTDWLRAN